MPSFTIHSPLLWTRHMKHRDYQGMGHVSNNLWTQYRRKENYPNHHGEHPKAGTELCMFGALYVWENLWRPLGDLGLRISPQNMGRSLPEREGKKERGGHFRQRKWCEPVVKMDTLCSSVCSLGHIDLARVRDAYRGGMGEMPAIMGSSMIMKALDHSG